MPIRPISPAGSTPADPLPPQIVVRARTRPGSRPPSSPVKEEPPRKHHIVDRTGPNWDEQGDYIVGKGRPPTSTRWQKGQSGNPRGPKAKEKKDPLSAFHEEVLADFTARVNGEEVKLNLGSFALRLIKAGAAKGTVRAQQMLLELFLEAVRHRQEGGTAPELEPWEQELIKTVLEAHGLSAAPVVRKSRSLGEHPGADT